MTTNTTTPAARLLALADEAEARYERARAKVQALCDGKERWTMSIPARPDSDPDIVISRGLRGVPQLAAALNDCRTALEQIAEIDPKHANYIRIAFDMAVSRFDDAAAMEASDE